MVKMIVCMKQVPMVSELPWDRKTGLLRREAADGMMNPACKSALEAALRIKEEHGGHITAITMGPPMAREILHEALAMGADRCLMVSDHIMAGADTMATSFTLARAIETYCSDFDLILCGCHTSDSETAQVGPQLAEELDIPSIAMVDDLRLAGRRLRIERVSDHFLETLEMDLPGLVTVTTAHFTPRYIPMAGLQDAFQEPNILTAGAHDLGIEEGQSGIKGSPTQILEVFSSTAGKQNVVMTGAPKKIVEDLFALYEDSIGSVIRKDLKAVK
ncbi:MAG TPA: electron transfer flavoprotein subunit beta/FixA family protein [Deltaproteobacteria bacterium]|jgi:electron transfer flavoprotein beta subunit|nr:electron transfer flavoprotein subunit beta/FixA family protein [Deltaproteobacteria bacterium]HOI07143.1 electron transfer flavoprotein subunit beta/FixA family protein [Deltaproteobacteria bacterium]